MDESISEWWNDDFDLILAREVDEYEQQSRFVSVNNEDIESILKNSYSKSTRNVQNRSLSCLKVRIWLYYILQKNKTYHF